MDLALIIKTSFSNAQVGWIFLALTFGLTSIILFVRKEMKLSLFFLFISGLILRFVAAGIDPFLNTWDEQFHALVAKNMMTNPFKPVLVGNPVLDYNFRDWTSSHIWLHKQPWFLWQIAFFFKMFGISEFTLRLPTAIMFSLMIPLIYRIGKLLSTPEIAWYGAFLYTFSCYFISFVTGSHFTDHNDSAFVFYVSLSVWAWIEYMYSGNRKWLFWIGLFSGIAVLNKWLPGLAVYAAWIVALLLRKEKGEKFRELIHLSASIIITILVVLPWQLFILNAYPLESRFEYFLNTRHFFQAVEGHAGNSLYHFWLLSLQYGGFLILFILLPGLFYFFSAIKDRAIRLSLLFMMAFVYLFFTLAATKMPMFCTIVSALIFLGIGAALDKGVCWLQRNIPIRLFPWLISILLFYLAYENLDINSIDVTHSSKQPHWNIRRIDAMIDKQVAAKLRQDECLVFNCGGYNTIMFMFYSGKTANGAYPDLQQYLMLKKKKIKMATFVDDNCPLYLLNDPDVKKIYSRLIAF